MRQVKSYGSAKAILLKKEEILKKLGEISKELREKYNWVKEVRIFGSIAKGKERGLSDVDILVITNTEITKENFWKLYGKVFDFIVDRLPISFDLILISEKEFKKNPKRFGETLRI